MSYSERYFIRFVEAPVRTLGVTKALFRLSFRYLDFTGTPAEICQYQDAGIKYSVSESGGPLGIFSALNPIRGTYKLFAETHWDARTLYVETDRDVQVVLLRDETGTGNSFAFHMGGWLQPAAYRESYAKKPYSVEVSSSCGLSTLKDRPLIDSAGKRLVGKVSLSHAIRTALIQTGFDLPLMVGDNLYHLYDMVGAQLVNGKANVTKCPLYQTLVSADTFLTETGDTQTAYLALERLLRHRGLRLTQWDGAWWIVRAEEVPGGYDVWNPGEPGVRFRRYQSADLAAAPTTNLSHNLNHTVYPTASLRAEKGGKIGLEPITPAVRLEQDFGGFVSKIPNGNFSEVDNLGFPTGWLRNNVPITGPLRPYRVGTGTEADPYGMVLFGPGDNKMNPDTPYIMVRIPYAPGSKERQGRISWKLTGRFKLQNLRAAKIVIFAIKPFETHHLMSDGWKKNPSQRKANPPLQYHVMTVDNVQKTKPGYAPISIDIPALAGIEFLQIHLCYGESLDQPVTGLQPFVIYERLRLESVQEGINIDGTQVTISKRKAKIDTTLSLDLGNIPPQGSPDDRTATLYSRTGGHTISNENWYRPDANVLGSDLGKTLLGALAISYAQQSLHPAQSFEDTVFGRLPFGLFTVLRLPDVGESIAGTPVPDPFVITRWEYYPRECEHTLTAIEKRGKALPVEAKTVGEWQTPDGPVPIEKDAGGLPIDPSLPVGKPGVHQLIDFAITKRFPAVLVGRPSLPGFTPLEKGETRLIGTAKKNGVITGKALSALRKLIDFKFPV